MAVAIRAEVQGAAELARRLSGLPAAIRAAERRGVTKAGLIVEREAGRKFVTYSGRRGDTSVVQNRNYALRRSLNSSVVDAQAGVEARVGYRKGAVDRYARMVEFGGTIRAKRRVLAIPIGANLDRRGVPRISSPEDVVDGFWFRSRAGNLVFGRRKGDGIEPLFVGKESVTIQGRRVLGRSLDEKRPEVLAAIRDEVARAAQAVAGG